MRERKPKRSPSGVTPPETLPPVVRVHIVGAGPVGLMLAALFQPMEGFSVHLYEKRREYTRSRMVQLRDYLVADSVASYCTDYIDGESVEAHRPFPPTVETPQRAGSSAPGPCGW